MQLGSMFISRARSEPGGIWWRTGGEMKGKLANGVGSQYSHANSERGLSSITQADARTSVASSRLNWRPHRFKWTRPFRGKTKSGFWACTITFRTNYNCNNTLHVSDAFCVHPQEHLKTVVTASGVWHETGWSIQ